MSLPRSSSEQLPLRDLADMDGLLQRAESAQLHDDAAMDSFAPDRDDTSCEPSRLASPTHHGPHSGDTQSPTRYPSDAYPYQPFDLHSVDGESCIPPSSVTNEGHPSGPPSTATVTSNVTNEPLISVPHVRDARSHRPAHRAATAERAPGRSHSATHHRRNSAMPTISSAAQRRMPRTGSKTKLTEAPTAAKSGLHHVHNSKAKGGHERLPAPPLVTHASETNLRMAGLVNRAAAGPPVGSTPNPPPPGQASKSVPSTVANPKDEAKPPVKGLTLPTKGLPIKGLPALGAPKLPTLTTAKPKGPQLVKPTFYPAPKLDPKQLKEAVRRWYKFDALGKMNIISAGKYELTRSLGVHSRDLRILDANVNSSYPSCILCRERALVINLEYIQVIVTTDTTLVLNAERANEVPAAKSFVEELQRRLVTEAGHHDAENARLEAEQRALVVSTPALDDAVSDKAVRDAVTNGERVSSPAAFEAIRKSIEEEVAQVRLKREAAQLQAALEMPGSAREARISEVPYELKVLEVCLDHIATYFSEAVKKLEEDSESALKQFTAKVTAPNLERVRKVKNRMVRLSTRVDTIRSLLEKYLGDDEDLAELHLSGQQVIVNAYVEKCKAREQRRLDRHTRYTVKRDRKLAEDPEASEPSSISNSTFTLSDEDTGWLSSQAEMIIEPYFMSFDNTYNRLSAIGEFVEDTEDYVNLILDSHRNQLIQVDLLLTMGSFCVGLVTLVAGIFGMNLASGLEVDSNVFVLVSVLSCALAIALLIAFVVLMRHWQLAFV